MSTGVATLPRLAKTLGMLGSEHDGEILAAAKAAEKLRRSLGVQWAALLSVPCAEQEGTARRGSTRRPDPPSYDPYWDRSDWRVMVANCIDNLDLFTDWEGNFLYSIRSRTSISPKQWDVLRRLFCKVWTP